MAWLRISVAPPESLREDCEQVLFSCGASSVSLESAGNDEVIEPSPGETPVWRDTRLVALFPEDTQTELVAARLTETLGKKPALKARLLEDRVWERVWLDDFKPTHIAESLWVSPKHAPVDEPGAVVIRMDPGLAFGSGTHTTTALCLEWLARHPIWGSVLDYGCGSGILAIAALKLGANRATATDIDPQALTATSANATANGVSSRIKVTSSDTLACKEHDVIVANILADALIALAPRLAKLSRPGGDLVLSGILRRQVDSVLTAYDPWFRFDTPTERDDWVLLTAKRRST